MYQTLAPRALLTLSPHLTQKTQVGRRMACALTPWLFVFHSGHQLAGLEACREVPLLIIRYCAHMGQQLQLIAGPILCANGRWHWVTLGTENLATVHFSG